MDSPQLLIALLAVVAYALVSRKLGRWWISMPMAMLIAGLVLGAAGLGLVEEDPLGEVVRTIAELTLALMLFHDAVRIDLAALRGAPRPRAPPRYRTSGDALVAPRWRTG